MVLHVTVAHAPPAPHHPGVNPPEVTCLKAALALVVVKRRLRDTSSKSFIRSPGQRGDDIDTHNNGRFGFGKLVRLLRRIGCVLGCLLGSQLTATAGAATGSTVPRMNHRSSIPSTGTPNGNGNHVTSATAPIGCTLILCGTRAGVQRDHVSSDAGR
jgi:hypothetical protein